MVALNVRTQRLHPGLLFSSKTLHFLAENKKSIFTFKLHSLKHLKILSVIIIFVCFCCFYLICLILSTRYFGGKKKIPHITSRV